MTILREGEKFACKQCIQGHRVSTCHHEERPLIHVARKGRPVSQCPHCRGLRKARSTHVRCECGERRHSRNTSSESNTLGGSDDNACQCSGGKKCTCALKKEPVRFESNLNVPHTFSSERTVNKPFVSNRRSESAVPRMRHTYQQSVQMQRSGSASTDLTMAYKMPQSPLGRNYHAAQRSVDSLPLLLDTPTQEPIASTPLQRNPPPMSNSSIQRQPIMSGPPSQFLSADNGLHNFNVSLNQDVLARTLSPQNPKRYSMNDWSMMTFTMQDMGQSLQDHYSGSGSEYPFPPVDAVTWNTNWASSSQRTPPPIQTMSGTCEPAFNAQPELSTSSTGTVSDTGDAIWHSDLPYTRQPTITVDPSCCQPIYDDSSNFSWTPASYQEMATDVQRRDDSVPPPNYGNEFTNDDFAEQPSYIEPNDFVFPGAYRNDLGPASMSQGLPDRSIDAWSSGMEAGMSTTAFKFPNHDNELYFSQPFAAQIDQQDWRLHEEPSFVKVKNNSL